MKKPTLLLIPLILCACAGLQESPYAGQEARTVKALSADEVRGIAEGAGMGYAKAAELNRYPGPMHALDMATALDLSATQREAIASLLSRHKAEARAIGHRVLDLEGELDALFASRTATPAAVDAILARLGAEQGALRGSHLKAHLATTALLSDAQVEKYQSMRGYGHAH
jgi:hypothetical protein